MKINEQQIRTLQDKINRNEKSVNNSRMSQAK